MDSGTKPSPGPSVPARSALPAGLAASTSGVGGMSWAALCLSGSAGMLELWRRVKMEFTVEVRRRAALDPARERTRRRGGGTDGLGARATLFLRPAGACDSRPAASALAAERGRSAVQRRVLAAVPGPTNERVFRRCQPTATAGHGTAQHGMAWHGMMSHGIARHVKAWHGMARHSTAYMTSRDVAMLGQGRATIQQLHGMARHRVT
eukprot:365467-Chlamydomonas_euryale.AAC.14